MAKFKRRRYAKRTFKKRRYTKRSIRKTFRAKKKNYETHKIAVKYIDEVTVPAGNGSIIFNAHVPWYFEEEKSGERLLAGIVDQDIF